MDVPDEFHTFCANFDQDMDLYDDPIQGSIDAGLEGLSAEVKERLKKFFVDVLENDLTDDELADLWAKSPSDIFLEGAGVKHVMSETLKNL